MGQDNSTPDFRLMLRELDREEVTEIAVRLMEQIHRQQTDQIATVEAVMSVATRARLRLEGEARPRH